MKRRFWVMLAAGVAILVALVAVALYFRGRVDPLPPAVRTAVEAEQASRARADSQIAAAWAEAEAARARELRSEARADSLQRAAHSLSRVADASAARARAARTVADSARYFEAAYLERTAERDTLLATVAQQGVSLAEARAQVAALAPGLRVADSARVRADSVLDAVVESVTKAQCTVPGTFGRIACPSRRTAFVVGVVTTVTGKLLYDAIDDGRLKIALPLP